MEKVKPVILKILKYAVAPVLFSVLGAAVVWGILYFTVGDVFGYADMVILDMSLHADGSQGSETDVMGQFDIEHTAGGKVYIEDIEFPKRGSVYGQIEIDSVGINCPLIYGDDEEYLKQGACQSPASYIVGYGGTTLIAGHNTRHFASLPQVVEGDIIRIKTYYGTYLYRVTGSTVLGHNNSSAYDLTTDTENVVLYTCIYENTVLGNVKKRLYVYGEYIESDGETVSSPLLTSRRDETVG